jgi:hypothetical protein
MERERRRRRERGEHRGLLVCARWTKKKKPRKAEGGEDTRKPMLWSGVDEEKTDGIPSQRFFMPTIFTSGLLTNEGTF